MKRDREGRLDVTAEGVAESYDADGNLIDSLRLTGQEHKRFKAKFDAYSRGKRDSVHSKNSAREAWLPFSRRQYTCGGEDCVSICLADNGISCGECMTASGSEEKYCFGPS